MNIEIIKDLINPILNQKDIILYDLKIIKQSNDKILQVSICYKDYSMNINTCQLISELISDKLDEVDLIKDNYILEVCSPGAERELRDLEDIKNNLNQCVYIKLINPKEGLDNLIGILKNIEGNILNVEYLYKNKKKNIDIEYNNINIIRLAIK